MSALGVALVVTSAVARAQPDRAAAEAEMFGEPDSPETPAAAAPPTAPTPFEIPQDPLALGGRLILATQATFFQDTSADEQPLGMPTLLDVYLDARPNPRVRAYFRGRLAYDPTIVSELGLPLIDQLWIKFDTARAVFWTVGTQPVRWGTGRVWNPSDIVNRARLDPLSPIDLRTGVPLLKAQIPIEGIGGSLQLVGTFAEATTLGQVGAAARLEMSGASAELALSAGKTRGRPLYFGVDGSTKLGPVDTYVEVAVAHGGDAHRWTEATDAGREDRDADWIPQAVVGVEWPIDYGDEDVLYVGAEYLFNDAGYDDDALYGWLVEQGDLQSFYLGRHYAAVYLVVPAPGRWDDTTLSLNGVYNASDRTGVVRANWSQRVLTHLYFEPFVVANVGPTGGEFRYPTAVGEAVHPPLGQVGAWLRLDL